MEYPTLRTIDYHAGGGPFRIVPELPWSIEGATVAERRVFAMVSGMAYQSGGPHLHRGPA